MSTLVRRLDLAAFAPGDTWAIPGDQSLLTRANVPLAVSTGSQVYWRLIPYTGITDADVPVTDTVTTVDARMALVTLRANGTLGGISFTQSLVACTGSQMTLGRELEDKIADLVGGQQLGGRILTLTIPAFTTGVGSAPAVWIWADGAVLR